MPLDAPIPFSSGLKVIKDRLANVYLSLWKGPEGAPTHFEWAPSLKDAYQLTKEQAHMVRAGIMAVEPVDGGRDELALMVIDYDDAVEAEHASFITSEAGGDVFIVHPAHGYYMSSLVKGKNVEATWNKSRIMAQKLPRAQAKDLIEFAGLHVCTLEPVPEGWAPHTVMTQVRPQDLIHNAPPAKPTPPAQQMIPPHATVATYDIITAVSREDLVLKVRTAQAAAVKLELLGGVVVDISSGSYMQALLRHDAVRKA